MAGCATICFCGAKAAVWQHGSFSLHNREKETTHPLDLSNLWPAACCLDSFQCPFIHIILESSRKVKLAWMMCHVHNLCITKEMKYMMEEVWITSCWFVPCLYEAVHIVQRTVGKRATSCVTYPTAQGVSSNKAFHWLIHLPVHFLQSPYCVCVCVDVQIICKAGFD